MASIVGVRRTVAAWTSAARRRFLAKKREREREKIKKGKKHLERR